MNCNLAESGTLLPLYRLEGSDDLQLNYVVLDPLNGQVLAMAGDFSPSTGQQAYLQPHPSGSLLTPFIYLAGMLRGMGPASLLWDTPTNLDKALVEQYLNEYEFQGPMRLRTALSEDHLSPATKILASQGEEDVIELMSGFGMQFYATEGIPFESGVTDSLAIAQAFGVFANDGNKAGQPPSDKPGSLSPTTVLTVTTGDNTILVDWMVPEQQAVIDPALAFMMNDMLSAGNNSPFRGSTKVGTTITGSDFLRVIYNPDYVFVIWVGASDSNDMPPLSELGIDTTLNSVLEGYYRRSSQFDEWLPPADVTRVEVCDPSGKLPGEGCPLTVMEYFLTGNEPTEVDMLFKLYPIDGETGRLATVFSNPTRIEQQVFFNPPQEEAAWAREAGYLLPPDSYVVFHSDENPDEKINITSPQDFETVGGVIDIKGRVSPEGFLSYRLDLGSGLAPSQWLQVGISQTELPETSLLGTLDTTHHANGLYTLRIQVIQMGYLVENAYVILIIDNLD